MRLFEKAKRFGTWNPSDIDLTQDRMDWLALGEDEQRILLHLTALFQAGEEAVTLDLLPLIMTVAAEGRLEEELFLTTFLFEEAKHTDFFDRFLRKVAVHPGSLEHFIGPNYRTIFTERLPAALGALRTDASALAQVRAAVTYNMIVEGVLAETGYHAYFKIMEEASILPGTREAIRLLKQDESRHIAYGIFLLSRLIAVDNSLWDRLEDEMNSLLVPAIGVIGEIFSAYDPPPFGLDENEFVLYASNQFARRMDRIEAARRTGLATVMGRSQEWMDE